MLDEKILQLKNRRVKIMGHKNTVKTSVLVPLVYKDEQLCLLFEKRALDMNRQPGEICFPGGTREITDKCLQETAVRETCEELGLKPKDIQIIASLDIFVSPYNFTVSPILAHIVNCSNIKPNPAEVDKLIFVPLEFLKNYTPHQEEAVYRQVLEDSFPYDLIPQGKNYPFRISKNTIYFYIYQGEVIWGLTARILTDFLEQIK